MSGLEKRWIERPGNAALERELVKQLHVSSLSARVLVNRGLTSAQAAEDFLHARLNALPDPDLLPDMSVACTRLAEALDKGERIAVHGDYDVDGISGTALLIEVLRQFGAEVEYHIPLRMKDGYGLSSDAIRRAAKTGCRLILTVDCGVSALAEAELAAALGLDLIVTDHHQAPPQLPSCLALINPHLAHSRFPFADLAGVGVAFFLLVALRRRLRKNGWFELRAEPDLRNSLDLVALGTIADMVPLTGINRVLVRYGLQLLEAGRRPGIVALKKVAEVTRVTCGTVGFRLAPRLNAAGRLEDAALGVQLLLDEGEQPLAALAQHLESCNRERQQVEAETLLQAIEQVDALEPGFYSLVLAGEGWHPGVIGIVASRLVERYYRPTVLIALDGEMGKGSARSIHGFHLFAGLRDCADALKSFGGHAAAAGLTLAVDQLESFRATFEEVVRREMQCEDLQPRIEYDAKVSLEALQMEQVEELAGLSPFGIGNPQPVVCCQEVNVLAAKIVGEKHLRFRAEANGVQLSCIAFGFAERIAELRGPIDLLCRPEKNLFRGQASVQLQVVDFRPA